MQLFFSFFPFSYLVFSSLPKLVTSVTVAVVSVYVLTVMRRLNKVCSVIIFSS